MRVTYWNPDIAKELATKEAMVRLKKAGNVLAGKVRENLRSAIKHSYNRPVYQSGPYAGKYWTARDAGELLKSVRVTEDYEGIHNNILIICGHSKAYYAAMFEYAADPSRGVRFFRPAISSSRATMKAVLENG